MNNGNPTGEVRPMIDRRALPGAPNGAHELNGNLGLSVNCFTPGDRQAPISLRCVEPSHMGNLGLLWLVGKITCHPVPELSSKGDNNSEGEKCRT
jgi:hypothetical protein